MADSYSRRTRDRVFFHFVVVICSLLLLRSCTRKEFRQIEVLPNTDSYTNNSPRFTSFDLFTPDSNKSITFYTSLFGWEMKKTEESGQLSILHNGNPIGTMIQFKRGDIDISSSRWISNLTVANLEKTLVNVKQYGGKIISGPENHPTRGAIAVIEDPEGAELLLGERQGRYPERSTVAIGDFVWVDLFIKNRKKSSGFYENVVGFDAVEEPGSSEHFYLVANKKIRGGMVVHTWEDVEANWLPYIGVKDLKTARCS